MSLSTVTIYKERGIEMAVGSGVHQASFWQSQFTYMQCYAKSVPQKQKCGYIFYIYSYALWNCAILIKCMQVNDTVYVSNFFTEFCMNSESFYSLYWLLYFTYKMFRKWKIKTNTIDIDVFFKIHFSGGKYRYTIDLLVTDGLAPPLFQTKLQEKTWNPCECQTSLQGDHIWHCV